MSNPVQLYCWHFMSYPYLPPDFDTAYETGWVTVPNRLWDSEKSRGLYQEYIDQLAYADEIGFDGMVLNEHHQNIYGLMPSPNLIAAALAQKTRRGKIVILGNLLPLHLNPLRMAEEYAMLDNMSDGRLIAGFAPGSGPETFNYDVPAAPSRVGSPETVYRRIFDLIEHAKAGHLLIQFHMGNMVDALTRKSMRLFADEVAPRLRQDSARLFARQFPELERTPEPAQ
jgi:alkanesulfonate monooxygenase SsuD/methylene tetrahydromethanopterin reductase-like flavin-dependent oxidoreductase (luciferase family)